MARSLNPNFCNGRSAKLATWKNMRCCDRSYDRPTWHECTNDHRRPRLLKSRIGSNAESRRHSIRSRECCSKWASVAWEYSGDNSSYFLRWGCSGSPRIAFRHCVTKSGAGSIPAPRSAWPPSCAPAFWHAMTPRGRSTEPVPAKAGNGAGNIATDSRSGGPWAYTPDRFRPLRGRVRGKLYNKANRLKTVSASATVRGTYT